MAPAAAATRVAVVWEDPRNPLLVRLSVDPASSGKQHTCREVLRSFCVKHRKKWGALSKMLCDDLVLAREDGVFLAMDAPLRECLGHPAAGSPVVWFVRPRPYVVEKSRRIAPAVFEQMALEVETLGAAQAVGVVGPIEGGSPAPDAALRYLASRVAGCGAGATEVMRTWLDVVHLVVHDAARAAVCHGAPSLSEALKARASLAIAKHREAPGLSKSRRSRPTRVVACVACSATTRRGAAHALRGLRSILDQTSPPDAILVSYDAEDGATARDCGLLLARLQGRTRVIQRFFNVGVLEAGSDRKASTL
jgi:hypothetical protein